MRDFNNSSYKVKKVLRKCEETKRKFMSSETVVLTSSVVKDDIFEVVIKRGILPPRGSKHNSVRVKQSLVFGSISE